MHQGGKHPLAMDVYLQLFGFNCCSSCYTALFRIYTVATICIACIRTFLRFSPKPYRRQYYYFLIYFRRDHVADELWVFLGNNRRNIILDFRLAGQNSVDSGFNYV